MWKFAATPVSDEEAAIVGSLLLLVGHSNKKKFSFVIAFIDSTDQQEYYGWDLQAECYADYQDYG